METVWLFLATIVPLLYLFFGIGMRVFVPYVREGLNTVAEAGTWRAFPAFRWSYLAMVLGPILEYAVAFATIDGLWQTMLSWPFTTAVAVAYAGTDIAKEGLQLGINAAKAVKATIKGR